MPGHMTHLILSDDDLVPYAFGEDHDSDLPAPPCYLRSCLATLISSESPAHFESALGTAESLVRAMPSDVVEVAVELTKVLLHLSDTYSLSDFTRLRHRAMVALAVCCPEQAVPYLTSQLYAPNYSIRQRIDVLEVSVLVPLSALGWGWKRVEVGMEEGGGGDRRGWRWGWKRVEVSLEMKEYGDGVGMEEEL